jgi:4-hydroxybenzoate polyprenyltransferase
MRGVPVSSDRVVRTFHSAWRRVLIADRFIRLHQLFFTAVWAVLGAASVGRDVAVREFIALLGVVVAFHVYTYVLNDVIDLPIDRTQPQRSGDPLVSGAIQPRQALLIALVQPFFAVLLTIVLGGSWRALATLLGGFALMGAYNLWGKRCAFPPLTDAIQGCAWGSLAIYAPLALGAEPGGLAWTVAVYVATFTLLFNGVHGSLRDLANDFATGARTTAIILGARPVPDTGNPHVPRALAVFASVVLAVLIVTSTSLILRNDFGYRQTVWVITALAVGALNLFAVMLQPAVVRPRGLAWDRAWRLQLYLLMMAPFVAFVGHLSALMLSVLLTLNAVALLLFGCSALVARWAVLAVGSVIRPSEDRRLVAGMPRTR